MHKIKEMLMNELYEYEEKAKRMSGGKISTQELEKIHKLSDTIKNLDKIEMYEEMGEEMGESSYARGGRGRGRNARRDSMGRYSRESGYSEEGGSSYEGGSYRRGGSSYEGGNMGNMGGSSYARGGQGRGGQGGSNYRGGSSYGGAKEHMIQKMEEMLEMAESPKERRAIEKCLEEIED